MKIFLCLINCDPIGALIRRPPPQPYRQPGAAPSAPVTSNLPKGTDPKRDPTAAKEAYGAQKRPAAPQGNAAAHTPAHTTDRAAARSTALAAEPVNRADDAMPGVSKPFRMPAMAGGANGPRQPAPQAIVPPDHAPLPRVAPRA